jgi:hypothetical protein
MEEEYPPQMFLAEHLLWCRGERDSMARELAKYKERRFHAAGRHAGKPLTQGAATHVAYLKSVIQHLDSFIAARSPRYGQPPSQTSTGEFLH